MASSCLNPPVFSFWHEATSGQALFRLCLIATWSLPSLLLVPEDPSGSKRRHGIGVGWQLTSFSHSLGDCWFFGRSHRMEDDVTSSTLFSFLSFLGFTHASWDYFLSQLSEHKPFPGSFRDNKGWVNSPRLFPKTSLPILLWFLGGDLRDFKDH